MFFCAQKKTSHKFLQKIKNFFFKKSDVMYLNYKNLKFLKKKIS